jgi:hypothetical protein
MTQVAQVFRLPLLGIIECIACVIVSSFGCPNAFGLAGKILHYRLFGIQAKFNRTLRT